MNSRLKMENFMKQLLAVLFGVSVLVSTAVAVERPRELSKKELTALLEKATTPQDHARLAGHYEAKAKKYEAEAAEHADMAKMYRARPTASESKRPMAPDTAAHCDYIAESLSKAAKEAHLLATSHEQMTKK
jgi:hypothetical protein